MKKNILLTLLLLAFVVVGLANIRGQKSTVRAVGDLNIDWGVPDGQPIFMAPDFLPGDTEERTVHIINDAGTIRPVGVRGKPTSELKDLAGILVFKISEGGSDLYGGTMGTKTLADFFEESKGINGIKLFSVNPGQTKAITFSVTFPASAGDEFQQASVIFDIRIGIAVEVPKECLGIQFSGDPIFGTEKRDVLNGTDGNDLIFGFEGDDVINGKAGDDCIVGGDGNDIIHSQNGNDIIFGGNGDDRLWGDNGNDYIEAGTGNDEVNAGNGNDTILGQEGDDIVRGDGGKDSCDAETVRNCELNIP